MVRTHCQDEPLRLRQALQQGQAETLRQLAHGVVGMAANVLLPELRDAAQRVQGHAEAGRLDAEAVEALELDVLAHGAGSSLAPLAASAAGIAALGCFDLLTDGSQLPVFAFVVKPGEAHGWSKWHEDMRTITDWFDKYLKAAPAGR